MPKKEQYWKNPEKYRRQTSEWQKQHPEKRHEISKRFRIKHYSKLRLKALIHYGDNPPKCACCGESEIKFLTIDHIINIGGRERKKYSNFGYGLYKWLEKNKYPEGLQVLCMNCNWGKQMNNGVCPHEK